MTECDHGTYQNDPNRQSVEKAHKSGIELLIPTVCLDCGAKGWEVWDFNPEDTAKRWEE